METESPVPVDNHVVDELNIQQLTSLAHSRCQLPVYHARPRVPGGVIVEQDDGSGVGFDDVLKQYFYIHHGTVQPTRTNPAYPEHPRGIVQQHYPRLFMMIDEGFEKRAH